MDDRLLDSTGYSDWSDICFLPVCDGFGSQKEIWSQSDPLPFDWPPEDGPSSDFQSSPLLDPTRQDLQTVVNEAQDVDTTRLGDIHNGAPEVWEDFDFNILDGVVIDLELRV